jgi:LacI family transcriptional regulator
VATIYDVARAAGVSTSTVSHVLNGTRYVSDDTKQRVQRVMAELRFRPNSLARSLVRQETQTIALLVPDNRNPFFAELARGIEDHGFHSGYNVILCNSDRSRDKEIAYLDMVQSKRVDGIVYMTTSADVDQLHTMFDQRIPVVAFDREYAGIDALLLDNIGGGYAATRHLIDLGHRRIACIAGPDALTRSHGRIMGYEQALHDAGLPRDPALLQAGNWTFESGWAAAQRLLALPTPPTAIFACNDTMAVGVMTCLHGHGIGVPHDISVVGFDNIALSEYVVPPLTTYSTPLGEVGQQLCQLLLDRINGDTVREPQRVVVEGELVVRQSTARHASQ